MIDEPVGRQDERDLIESMLDAALQHATAMIIDGEAGIGKTYLWRWAVDRGQARDFRVLQASPGPSESNLAFSALGDLLEDAVEEIATKLPRPQADALEVAVLRRSPGDDLIDLRAVSVACVSGLRLLADSKPTIVAVDDVQWLDASTRSLTLRTRSRHPPRLHARRVRRGAWVRWARRCMTRAEPRSPAGIPPRGHASADHPLHRRR